MVSFQYRRIYVFCCIILHRVFAKSCPNPYEVVTDICMWYGGNMVISIKDAVNKCDANKGRLPTQAEAVIAHGKYADSSYLYIHVCVTDFAYERYTNKTGWRDFNGNIVAVNWHGFEPTNGGSREDCIIMVNSGLADIDCHRTLNAHLVCVYEPEYDNKPLGTVFTPVPITSKFNEDNAAFEERQEFEHSILTTCILECFNRKPKCKGLFYEKNNKKCMLTYFAVAALPTSYNQPGYEWMWYSDVMN